MGDKAFTEDKILGGALTLRQPKRGHRVGHDAVLLAAATPAQSGETAIDIGAGVGGAGLALARRVVGLRCTLIDMVEPLVTLAQHNIALNRLSDRVRAVALDVAAPTRAFTAAGLAPGGSQRVLMNPPFNDSARQNASPDARRRLAHAAPRETLGLWARRANSLLAPSGTLTLIWRADGLGDVLAALGRGFGGIRVLPVYPRPAAAAIRILVTATKGSRAPLTLLPGFMLNDAQGRPTAAAEDVLRGGAALRLVRA
jgi:tRNA1(Val) A37 N6-methylase TrmN6